MTQGSTYKASMAASRAALASYRCPPGITSARTCGLWGQGETDGQDGTGVKAAAYQANLGALFTAWRAERGDPNMWIFILRLSSSSGVAKKAEIQAAQDAYALTDAHCTLINTDAFQMSGDGLHFTAAGAEALGLYVASLIHAHFGAGVTLIDIKGQSNVVSQTDTRVATDAKYATLAGVLAWIWIRLSKPSVSDTRHKTKPWQPYSQNKYYPYSTPGRAWCGMEMAMAWALWVVYGHTLYVIQASEGGTDLANDWAPA